MPRSRRSLLLGSGVAVATLAGCQRLVPGSRPRIDLILRNYTEDVQPLQVSLLREDGDTRQEAVVLDDEYAVPPDDDGSAGTIRTDDIVPERRYLVRILPRNGRFERFHAHYYPAESGPEAIDVSIRRDETTGNLFVDFRALP